MTINRAHYWLLWALLLMTTSGHVCAADTIIDSDDSVLLSPVLHIWVPPTSVTIEEVVEAEKQDQFKPIDSLALPYLSRDVWYRFNYTSTAENSRDLILNFNELLYSELELFERRDGHWESTSIKADQPISARPIEFRFFAFPLHPKPNTPATVYFRVNSFTHSFVAPRLETGRQFFRGVQHQTIFSVSLLGFLAAVTAYMWTVARIVLSPAKQIVLTGLLVSNVLYVFYVDGHFSKLLGGHQNITLYGYIITTALLYIFHLLYCRLCLNLHAANRFVGRMNDVVIAFILAATCYSLIAPVEQAAEIAIRTSATALVMMVIASSTAAIRRQPGATFYFVAIVCFILIAIYKVLVSNGFVDYTQFYRNYTYIGALSLTILLSLSLLRQLAISRSRQDALERKATEAEARDTSKGQFLATMGQEIRTPINGVIGMAQLLSESRLDSTQRGYVDVLLNSSKTLQNVIEDILDLSKVNANNLVLEKVDFNLDQLLIYTITSFSQTNHGKPIKFDLNEVHPMPLYLRGDPTRIQQIINNLLRYSFSSTERGLITLNVSELSKTDTNTTLKFSVTDSSSGNFQGDPESLFDPFSDTQDLPLFGDNATPLGMAICKRLVELMGGEIGFDRIQDKGNEYWFTLNLEIDSQRQQQLERATTKLKDSNIAMVFGSPLFSKGLLTYFSANNISVVEQDYDLMPEEINLGGIDMLLLSNALGEATRNWLTAAQMESTEVLVFNGIEHNIFANTELREMGVGVINPPYGISQIIEVIGRLISDEQDDVVQHFDATSNKHGLSKLRILVAEDNLISTKVIEAILKSYDIDADFVTTGLDAVSYYETNNGHYDLILMDYQMPEMDGCGATVKIREIEHNKSMTPTIIYAITAYTSSDYKIRCMRAGMNGILNKPLQKALLLELLESVNTKHAT